MAKRADRNASIIYSFSQSFRIYGKSRYLPTYSRARMYPHNAGRGSHSPTFEPFCPSSPIMLSSLVSTLPRCSSLRRARN